MSDTDPLDLLRAANPVSENSTPQPRKAPDALFKEITMNTTSSTVQPQHGEPDSGPSDPNTMPSLPGGARSRRRWRPSIALPAAAAVAGLVVGGAVIFNPGDSRSAHALVNDAATASAGFESGHVEVAIEIEESSGDDSSGRFVLDYRFDGNDFSVQFDGSEFDDGSVVVGNIDIRGVGDQLYTSYEDTPTFFVGPRSPDTESIDALFGFRPTSMEPSTTVALLEQTNDFEKVTSSDGSTTYRGSVSLASLEAIGPDSLPAGLSLLADPDTGNEDLPETLGVDVVVVDGLLDTVTIEIDGESPLGYQKGTITTTFSDYGQPQNIVAPPADQISDDASAGFPGGMPEGFEEALAVINEVESRRPGLCSDVFGEPTAETSAEDILAELDAFPACLEAAGEQAAADAFRSLSAIPD